MTARITLTGLRVDPKLYRFVENEVLPGTGLASDSFWRGFEAIFRDFAPRNAELLTERVRLQADIDLWHAEHPGALSDVAAYRRFLESIGYLQPTVPEVVVSTSGVDDELALQAGPQLVVPILNARYALNAANARWGSLYDALYGSDVIPRDEGTGQTAGYDAARGDQVVTYAREVFDRIVPLLGASHRQVTGYRVVDGRLEAALAGGDVARLADASQFVGYQGDPTSPTSVVLRHHRLHLEIRIDRDTRIGAADAAGISDVLFEAALSTIMDLEDSVAVVDADDKVQGYRNWLGLQKGTLTDRFFKDGQAVLRRLHPDRVHVSPEGGELRLPGRSLMFIRNVGHLMSHSAVLNDAGQPVPEGILDAVITAACALHDLKRTGEPGIRNSRAGSIYIVKPKMHGPAEVAFTVALFSRVEQLLGLQDSTIKLGLMDEERRTSLNLQACIAAASSRIVFINTGFLDRTGDEIHTAMHAGPVLRKGDMKGSDWIQAYERNNVRVGLACGLRGRGQIGKGMWAMPDQMADMLVQKIAHPKAGANTAWVPSPTAATLHALHYHEVDVPALQERMEAELRDSSDGGEQASLDDALLRFPVVDSPNWSADERQQELENNAQGILGYVVRWIDQGIGCSKVPDIHGIGLMEDRATLRISSQHIANWLLHGIVDKAQVCETFERMAAVVDLQNAADPSYTPMSDSPDTSIAYQAALDLVFKGLEQTNGYCDPLLQVRRLEAKARDARLAPSQTGGEARESARGADSH